MKTKIGIAGILLTVCLASCAEKENSKAVEANRDGKKDRAIIAGVPAGAEWEFDASKSDEFNSLDTTKWSTEPLWYDWNGVTGDFVFKPSNVVVSGGYARLIAKKEDHNNHPNPAGLRHYTAGCLKSKFEVGEDTYTEIYAKMIKKEANVCAAIWLGDQPAVAKNPNIEIDLQETKFPIDSSDYHNCSLLDWPMPFDPLHPNNNRGTWFHQETSFLDEGFHTYGVERRNGRIRIFIDELLRLDWDASVMPEYVTQLRPLVLSIEGHAGAPVDAELPAEFLIDWVHVFNVKK